MDEDIISLLIYGALALLGVIASAFKKKKQQQRPPVSRPSRPNVPPTMSADPYNDYGPELGPLAELFDLPKTARDEPKEPEYESIEYGPTVEEEGYSFESAEASAELAGMEVERPSGIMEKPVSEIESFEEGQSEIQKMIARYDAVKREMENSDDDIAKGEIVSLEAEEEAAKKEKSTKPAGYFDARKAIIYSEILKRREY